MGNFERKFQGNGGSSTNEFWRQKTRFPGLSRGVVSLRDPTFSRFDTIPACDTHTHRRTRNDGYYPRRASSTRVKTDEPIEMSFGMISRLGSRNSALRRGNDPQRGRGNFGPSI